MKERIIFGANSVLAEAVARLWARRGDHLVLVGRHGERLAALAKDLLSRGASKVEVTLMDFDNPKTLQKEVIDFLNDRARIDTVFVAHAIATPTREDSPFADLEKIDQTNFLSAAAILLAVKPLALRQRHGTLAAVSCFDAWLPSGESYFYGSSKAALECFMEGLRAELRNKSIHVCTIVPGALTATPLTPGLARTSRFAIRPELAAHQIVHQLEKQNYVFAPGYWRWVLLLSRIFPILRPRLQRFFFSTPPVSSTAP